MDYESYKVMERIKPSWKTVLAETVVCLIVAAVIVYTAIDTYRNHQAAKSKFTTTVERDNKNPCRIIVISRNQYEERSFAAVMEGCAK